MMQHLGRRYVQYINHAFGAPERLFAVHDQYERLGRTNAKRQLAYRELFRSELDSSELGEIRDAVNCGWLLGGERFKDEMESALKCAVCPPKRARPTRSVMPSEQGEPFG